MVIELAFRQHKKERRWSIIFLRSIGLLCGLLFWESILNPQRQETGQKENWLTWQWILSTLLFSILILSLRDGYFLQSERYETIRLERVKRRLEEVMEDLKAKGLKLDQTQLLDQVIEDEKMTDLLPLLRVDQVID